LRPSEFPGIERLPTGRLDTGGDDVADIAPFAARLADNHSSMPAAVTPSAPPTASGSEAVCPENRVKALDVFSWPRVRVRSPESPDRRWGNRPRYDGKAVGTVLARYYDPSIGQFLTLDPKAASTLSPYGYVDGNPINEADPSGQGVACGDSAGSCGSAYDAYMTDSMAQCMAVYGTNYTDCHDAAIGDYGPAPQGSLKPVGIALGIAGILCTASVACDTAVGIGIGIAGLITTIASAYHVPASNSCEKGVELE
jgi:RHS repeat-associated protein